jgi:hypothetical protein
MSCLSLASLFLVIAMVAESAAGQEPAVIPKIEEPWWTIAGDPDLGALTSPKQQPVDFAVWEAADGRWQLWSCIRGTNCGGKTRLFYRWEGKKLTDANWAPMGIAMQADAGFGETPGGLQAPHVVKLASFYHMFYGDWEHICLAIGMDGKTFARQFAAGGKSGMFSQAAGANTRDSMLLSVGDTHYCYYTAHPEQRGAVYCRTSKDLRQWSDATVVAAGGKAGTGPGSAECPHVVAYNGWYYLFRTQHYGKDAQTSVYRSKDPLDFGVNDDRFLVCQLPIAAPEIVQHDGQYYVAALLPSLKGIQVAKLEWGGR